MKNLIHRYRNSLGAPLKKIDKHIEIVGSNNQRLNSMAKDSQDSLLKTLSRHYSVVNISLVDDMFDLEALVAKKPDLVVLGVKLILLDPSKSYDDSPKMWLSEYLLDNNITFTGSSASAMRLEFDKQEAKQKVIDYGLESSPYIISKLHQKNFNHTLKFPLFVKPSNRGDSKGIDENSVVNTEAELQSKIAMIHNDFDSDALVEEYLPGREFSVAVINWRGTDELLAMPIEITSAPDSNGNSFLSSQVKEADSEKVIAVKNEELKMKINTLAIGVFKALGSRDYGRIDMRLDALGKPSFIEANLMPGLSDHGYLSRCFLLNEKINYESMVLNIIGLGIDRSVSEKAEALLENVSYIPAML